MTIFGFSSSRSVSHHFKCTQWLKWVWSCSSTVFQGGYLVWLAWGHEMPEGPVQSTATLCAREWVGSCAVYKGFIQVYYHLLPDCIWPLWVGAWAGLLPPCCLNYEGHSWELSEMKSDFFSSITWARRLKHIGGCVFLARECMVRIASYTCLWFSQLLDSGYVQM